MPLEGRGFESHPLRHLSRIKILTRLKIPEFSGIFTIQKVERNYKKRMLTLGYFTTLVGVEPSHELVSSPLKVEIQANIDFISKK